MLVNIWMFSLSRQLVSVFRIMQKLLANLAFVSTHVKAHSLVTNISWYFNPLYRIQLIT